MLTNAKKLYSFFYSKKAKKTLAVLGFLSIYLFCLLLRLYPLFSFSDSDSYEKATLLTIAQLKSQSLAQARQQFAEESGADIKRQAKKIFDQRLKDDSNRVKEIIDQRARKIFLSKGVRPRPYLLAADSYNYYGLTKNLIETGNLSETIKGSKFLNKKMLAPLGHMEPLNAHPYLGAYLFQMVRFFSPKADLMFTLCFIPVILTILGFCALFFCARCYNIRIPFIIISSFFLFLAPIILRRTSFGWYDNDPYNIIFPFLILGLYAKTFSSQRKSFLWAFVLCLCFSLYSLFWHGWGLIFGIIILSGLIHLITEILLRSDRSCIKKNGQSFGIIFLGTFLGIGLLFGFTEFFVLLEEGLRALKDFLNPELSLWPNVYFNVGELHRMPLDQLISHCGGYLFFLIGLFAVFAWLYQSLIAKNNKEQRLLVPAFILYIVLFALSLKAQRFSLLFVVPAGIFFALGLNLIWNFLMNLKKNKPSKRKIGYFGLWGVSCLILIASAIQSGMKAYATIFNWRPIVNQTWEEALLKIKNDTPDNSIINTWWPPGHFITSMADRRVTFDGATINVPQAYWLSCFFLNQDEKEALGILRMLNNSANQASELLMNSGIPIERAVKHLKAIVPLNKKQASQYLHKLPLTGKHIRQLLDLTHKKPPPSYIFLYKDLIEKNLELSFIAHWDFRKVREINQDRNALEEIPRSDPKKFVRYIWNKLLTEAPLKYSETLGQILRESNKIYFQQGIMVDLGRMSARINSEKFGQGIPQMLIFQKDGQLIEKPLENSNLPAAIVLLKNAAGYECILMDIALARSLLMKLYYFQGAHCKYLRLFSHHSNPTKRTKILIYEVLWDKFLEDTANKVTSF